MNSGNKKTPREKNFVYYINPKISSEPLIAVYVDGSPYFLTESVYQFFYLSDKYKKIIEKNGKASIVLDKYTGNAWMVTDIGAPIINKSNANRYVYAISEKVFKNIGLNKKRRVAMNWFNNYVSTNIRNRYETWTKKEWHIVQSNEMKDTVFYKATTYQYGKVGRIKTVEIDGEIWVILRSRFLRKIGFIKGTGVVRASIPKKDRDEVFVIKNNNEKPQKECVMRVKTFYAYLSSSNSPKAKTFKEWVEANFFNHATNKEPRQKTYTEGKIRQVTLTQRERNPKNRAACLAVYGYSCQICGFDFERFYGEIGRGYIHVHHIEMISSYKEEKEIDPAKDLLPVCPNCHAMLHKEDPPMHPSILKRIIAAKAEVV